jgi:YidC/Oxa1 family membrane protein insertase
MERATSRFVSIIALLALSMGAFGLSPRLARAQDPAISAAGSAAEPRTLLLENELVRVTVSSKGAALSHVLLKDARYQHAYTDPQGKTERKPIDIVTTDNSDFYPLQLAIQGSSLARSQVWQSEQLDAHTTRFSTQAGPLALVRKLELGEGPYQIWSTLRLRNTGKEPLKLSVGIEGYHYVLAADEEGGMFTGRSPLMAGAICMADGDPQRFDSSAILEDKPSFAGSVSFGSVDNIYFTQAIAAHGKPYASCKLWGSPRGGTPEDPIGRLLRVTLERPPLTLAPGQEVLIRDLAYLGPKSAHVLEKAGHDLPRASFGGGIWGIDRISHGLVGLLAWIQKFVSNWGVAIILLTLFVKLTLYPLTAKSFESMAAMRKFKPEIDALNEKYANDREKKGAAMMELYKKHKINPFGGCLPQLLQLPIWWALYSSLSTNVELFHQPFFLWWSDLTAPDPFYILPLALGALMFVQQKITPSTMDPQQAKMMLYMMPTMITAFMLFLPAGLCLYMFTNSLLSIAQQRFIEHRLGSRNGSSSPPSTAGSPSGTKAV